MTKRLDLDEYFLRMAEIVMLRGTCDRKQVGCVLVNGQNHVLATGYNGVPRRMPHCIDSPCPGARSNCSGSSDGLCIATHAEQNALLQCKDVEQIAKCYVTISPCLHCTKLLLNTACQTVVTRRASKHQDAVDLWTQTGREIIVV